MTQELKVSERIQLIASLITPGVVFADIGSDHAYLPCYACGVDSTLRAVAGEVNLGPYNSARKTVEVYKMSEHVTVRLGDGLEVIDESVTEVVIAGMGGSLIESIIEAGDYKLKNISRMILQPNNNEKNVRNVLLKYNFTIIEELIMEENNHIYEIIIAEKNNELEPYSPILEFDKQQMFGPILMHKQSHIFKKKWLSEADNFRKIIKTMEKAKQRDDKKIALFNKQLKWIEEVLANGTNKA